MVGHRRRPRPASEAGFTLIEVLVASVILAIGITALFALVDSSVKASFSTRAREGATSLARQVLEDAHTLPYSQMSPTSITEQLQGFEGLKPKQPAPAAWQVSQRGITYTISVKECAIDDPKNNYGEHTNAAGEKPFCNDPGEKEWPAVAGEEKDPLPENLKRITVDVTWVAKGRSPDVREVETLTAAGEAVGLSAYNLKLSQPTVKNPTAPLITEKAVTQLVFTVSSPKGTTGMIWSLEGSHQTPAPTETESGGTGWTFTWPITGISDGTYKVTAQAVNATGVVGPPDTIAVTLIRGTPGGPSGIQGGFNTVNVGGKPQRIAELQWHANSERNVIGYRVYDASHHLICPASLSELSLAVTCADFTVKSAEPQPSATYTVVALYRPVAANGETLSSELISEGSATSFTVVGGEPPPAGPNAPENLKLVKNADGSVTLSWAAPKSGAGEVSFYRIYRGSSNYASRYDVTGATTYTDKDATEEHSYWVTAVNTKLTESAILGPVTG
ncbi:MAG TPA: prepilin-type N-terminal cleavage/methylation domain-containing protein [Solirubrobacteraceae bacterium]